MLACVGAQTPWRADGRIVASGLAREPQSPVADQAMARRFAPGPSAKLLGKHDDDPLRAAAIAEPVPVLVALHPTRSSPPRACNPATAASMSSTAKATRRIPSGPSLS
jgi:hypothetical protein